MISTKYVIAIRGYKRAIKNRSSKRMDIPTAEIKFLKRCLSKTIHNSKLK